jgi:hypothetical protein
MGEHTYIGPFIKRKGRRSMSERERSEWIRSIWFVIAATFVIHLALLLDANKSFF